MLGLYHAGPLANSMKALLYLKGKGLDFVSHYVDLLRFEQHEPAPAMPLTISHSLGVS